MSQDFYLGNYAQPQKGRDRNTIYSKIKYRNTSRCKEDPVYFARIISRSYLWMRV